MIHTTNRADLPWAVMLAPGIAWEDQLRRAYWCVTVLTAVPEGRSWDRDRDIDGRWLFKRQEDAVQFALTWG